MLVVGVAVKVAETPTLGTVVQVVGVKGVTLIIPMLKLVQLILVEVGVVRRVITIHLQVPVDLDMSLLSINFNRRTIWPITQN
jgi:hypothetical protein